MIASVHGFLFWACTMLLQPEPTDVPMSSIWKKPADLDTINQFSLDGLVGLLGMKVTAITEDSMTASMPVMSHSAWARPIWGMLTEPPRDCLWWQGHSA